MKRTVMLGLLLVLLSATAAQNVATWAASGAYTGRLAFAFENSWNWPTGTYTVTLVFTLTAL